MVPFSGIFTFVANLFLSLSLKFLALKAVQAPERRGGMLASHPKVVTDDDGNPQRQETFRLDTALERSLRCYVKGIFQFDENTVKS